MVTVLLEGDSLSVPEWVTDINSFRRWTDEEEFPDNARVWWLKGEVWVDLSGEESFTHVGGKTRFTRVLDLLVEEEHLGSYLTDGVLLSNFAADFSGVPDGLFLSAETLASD